MRSGPGPDPPAPDRRDRVEFSAKALSNRHQIGRERLLGGLVLEAEGRGNNGQVQHFLAGLKPHQLALLIKSDGEVL